MPLTHLFEMVAMTGPNTFPRHIHFFGRVKYTHPRVVFLAKNLERVRVVVMTDGGSLFDRVWPCHFFRL
jgi:hypothetical protein